MSSRLKAPHVVSWLASLILAKSAAIVDVVVVPHAMLSLGFVIYVTLGNVGAVSMREQRSKSPSSSVSRNKMTS